MPLTTSKKSSTKLHGKTQDKHFYCLLAGTTMKSYIQHLKDPDCSSSLSNTSNEDLGFGDRRLREGKRIALVRSLSDPLLPVADRVRQPIRRGRKRPSRGDGLTRNNSFDGEFQLQQGSSCATNALKPIRRSSIDNNKTTLASAIRQQYQNATRPTRRGSLEHSKANSCPDFSESGDLTTTPVAEAIALPDPPKLRTSQKNLLFRAKILCNALDDMGLFDDDDDLSSKLTLTPKLLGRQ